jgi:hypothetical protein
MRYAAFSNDTKDPRIPMALSSVDLPRLYLLQHTQPSLKTRGEGERFHDLGERAKFWVAVGQYPQLQHTFRLLYR